MAEGCAIDPMTGNLAVTNYFTAGGGDGDVAIYPKAQGTPTEYSDSNIAAFAFCAYDKQGNLFSTGSSEYYRSNLFELSEGDSSFTDIPLNISLNVGSVQWTGGHLTAAAIVESPHGKQPVYQIYVVGGTGTVSEPTMLSGRRNRRMRDEPQFWVQGGTIISAYYWGGNAVWRYPQGGRPTKVIGAPDGGGFGVTVSVIHHG